MTQVGARAVFGRGGAGEEEAGPGRRLVLDCIGYTEAHRVAATCTVPVLLARGLAVRLAAEAACASRPTAP
ncbi:AroM family protein [Streptomyces violens]|uniref:AroM family protein n=1 Tax=Streptomyces violens TaxID=66377 RepID=UPI0004BF4232|nr:AroM family protein [Streptomyces violens]